MNYLAHAYLSYNEPAVLVGNMISDFVKGKRKFTYPVSIQKGIYLHRAIDGFTDFHPATKAAKLYFRPAYRLYAGAFIDVVYDHFLALDPTVFIPGQDLENFSRNVYKTLEENYAHLPENFQKILPFMKRQNWLVNYQHKSGIKQSFEGLVYRSVYLSDHETAFSIFKNKYQDLKKCYEDFFPELHSFASNELRNLLMV